MDPTGESSVDSGTHLRCFEYAQLHRNTRVQCFCCAAFVKNRPSELPTALLAPPGHTSFRFCDVHRCAAAAVQVLVAAGGGEDSLSSSP